MINRNIHAQFEHTLIEAIKELYTRQAKSDAVIAHRCFYGLNESIIDTPVMGLNMQDVVFLAEHAVTRNTGQIAQYFQKYVNGASGSILESEYYHHLTRFCLVYGQLLEKLYPVFLVAFGQFDSLQSQDLRNDYNGQVFQTAQDWIIAVIQRNWSAIAQHAIDVQTVEIERIQAKHPTRVYSNSSVENL